MISYWERNSFSEYDVIIIGAGIVGLSTAYSIKKKYTSKSVLVMERGILPSGASTKNAGFTTFGGVGELIHDLKNMPAEQVLQLVQDRWEGLHILRERLGDDIIGYENYGGYELILEQENFDFTNVERINEFLFPVFNQKVFSRKEEMISELGFPSSLVKGLIFTPLEGQLDTGKMMKALYRKCISLGIEILNGANVESFKETGNEIKVTTSHHYLHEAFNFKAQQLVICTNAFATQFFPQMDITPGRGQVLVTKPIDGLKLKGIFHFDEGFYYFRNIENRILFGGGRNLDFKKEATTAFEYNEEIQKTLDHYLQELIIPGVPYEVDMRWTGIMAFGQTKLPIVEKISERIYVGVRMNGIGVALGSKVGERLAGMMTT